MQKMSELEKLVTEMQDIWFNRPLDVHTSWLIVAKHVQRLVLKARIKDLIWSLEPNKNKTMLEDPYSLVEERIAELTKQLEELQ